MIPPASRSLRREIHKRRGKRVDALDQTVDLDRLKNKLKRVMKGNHKKRVELNFHATQVIRFLPELFRSGRLMSHVRIFRRLKTAV